MATPVTSTVCSLCGKTLEREGDCLACILRGGLDENESEPLPMLVSYSRYRPLGERLGKRRSLRRCFGSIRCSTRFVKIRVFQALLKK
jgi:hypothetical protein